VVVRIFDIGGIVDLLLFKLSLRFHSQFSRLHTSTMQQIYKNFAKLENTTLF